MGNVDGEIVPSPMPSFSLSSADFDLTSSSIKYSFTWKISLSTIEIRFSREKK